MSELVGGALVVSEPVAVAVEVEHDAAVQEPVEHGGGDASDRKAFELMSFAVNGEDRPIRRSARKTSQTYTASIGHEALDGGEPVTITYTYRTITRRAGHLLFFDIERPTRDLRIDFDYAGCDIESVSTLDLVPTMTPPRIEVGLPEIGSEVVRVALDGWVFPRSGVAFVWTLSSEAVRRHGRVIAR